MFEWVNTVADVDSRIAATVEEGLFEMCQQTTVVITDSFDNGAECLSTVADWRGTHIPQSLADQLRDVTAAVTVEQDVRLRVFRRH